jgi:integrase
MASVSTNAKGLRRILFHDADGKRRCVYLGRMAKKAAEDVRDRIDELLARRAAGLELTVELEAWARDLSDEFHEKLEAAGLVDPRKATSTRTVGGLLDKFLSTQLVKASTHKSYKQTLDSLREFLGTDTLVRAVTAERAAEWRKHIATQTENVAKKRTTADNTLSPATVAKRVNVARVVFNRAVEWGIIATSPFASLTPGSQVNEANEVQVPREWTARILEACPSSKWRLVYGLARLAALRIPSELVDLSWADVDWDRGRLTVNASKTEHHGAGHGIRLVPICPELMRLLEEHFEQAQDGAVAVFPDITAQTNLGTSMRKIIAKAGLVPWVRLFDNCRASCENDWADELPAHVVEKWTGHSGAVARKHYLRAQDHHFETVVSGSVRRDAPDDARATQTAAQHDSAAESITSHESLEVAIAAALVRARAELCGDSSIIPVGDIGLEPMTPSLSS